MNDDHSHKCDDTCGHAPQLYVHVYHDGEIMLLGDDGVANFQSDITQLKTEITRIEKSDGLIRFSYDQNEEPSELAQEIVECISNANAMVEIERYPLPVVYGFNKSYAQYIWDAIEVAEMDLDGINFNVTEDEELLKSLASDSKEYQEIQERIVEGQSRLKYAEYALNKLNELALDICAEPEGGEH